MRREEEELCVRIQRAINSKLMDIDEQCYLLVMISHMLFYKDYKPLNYNI